MLDYIRSVLPKRVRRQVRRLADAKYRRRQNEIRRLENLPRRTRTTTDLLGETAQVVDAASFLSAYRSIFEDEIYAFEPESERPRIIDGGANIGLATLYWKRQFPKSRITAFEPDPQVFEALKWNIESHGFNDVALVQKGLWCKETELAFQPDGADGGHVEVMSHEVKNHMVPVTRLVPYLKDPVDLLKLDIEGAEVEVIQDAAGHLQNVRRLFVEYHSYIGEEQRVDVLLRVLREAGFRLHIQPELVADQPFIDRLASCGMDHRLNIFAYRV